MNKKYLLAIAACSVMLAACGDDVTKINEIHQDGIAVLEAGKKLSEQACDTANVGEMLFVADSSEVFFCDGESWQTLKGADGKDGVDGKDGADGVDGKDGKDGADGKDGKDGADGEKGDKGAKGDKGSKGDSGDDGANCTAQSVTNAAGLEGLEVTCGGAVVDTIWNGAMGESGKDGVGCTLNDEGDGKVTVSCGKGSAMTTATLYKAVCGTKPYDPAKSFCSEGELYSCDDKPYDPKKQYCLKVTRGGTDIYSVEALLTDARDAQNIQVYKTVKICNDDKTSCQTWMAENLNYSVNPDVQSWCGGGESGTTNEGDCSVYGRLYTWAAAVGKSEDECGDGKTCNLPSGDIRGVCPGGWHLPSKDEWESLFAAVGGSSKAGTALKSQTGWISQTGDVADRDAYGFSALPAGFSYSGGDFSSAGDYAYFWSASENNSYDAYYMYLDYYYENANVISYDKDNGYSVRCLQNN